MTLCMRCRLTPQRPTGRNTAEFIELEVRKRTSKLEESVQVLAAQKLSAEVAAANCKTQYTAEVLLSWPAPPSPLPRPASGSSPCSSVTEPYRLPLDSQTPATPVAHRTECVG